MQSRSNCIRLSILFDFYYYEPIKNKMVANEEEPSIAVQKYPVIFDKSNKDFHRKGVKKRTGKTFSFLVFIYYLHPDVFLFPFLFWRLLLLLKMTRITARRWCLLTPFWKQQFYVLKLINKNVLEWFQLIMCKEHTVSRSTNLLSRNYTTLCFWLRKEGRRIPKI